MITRNTIRRGSKGEGKGNALGGKGLVKKGEEELNIEVINLKIELENLCKLK